MKSEIKVIFTKHANQKLLHRRINRNLVVKTVYNPTTLVIEGNKYHVYRKFGRLYLKVIFIRLGKVALVVTQYFVKKLS